MSPNRLPTTIVSGFLGAGKTTIILHLIEQLQAAGQQVVYLKNEIGDLAVDSELVKGQNIATKELLNGCICCTLVGPFRAAIDEIVSSYKPDRLIIEASGAADPSAIALMVSSHPRLVRDGVLSVIDVMNFSGYKDLSPTAQNQARFTDLIVFNKVELANLERKRAVVGYVRELNGHSPIVEAPHGKISTEVAFGISGPELERLLINKPETQHHLHDEGIESFQYTLSTPTSKEQIEIFLARLPLAVIRVKGVVQLTDGQRLLLNKVGQRSDTLEWDYDLIGGQAGEIVVIGFHLDQHRSEIERLVANLSSNS